MLLHRNNVNDEGHIAHYQMLLDLSFLTLSLLITRRQTEVVMHLICLLLKFIIRTYKQPSGLLLVMLLSVRVSLIRILLSLTGMIFYLTKQGGQPGNS